MLLELERTVVVNYDCELDFLPLFNVRFRSLNQRAFLHLMDQQLRRPLWALDADLF